MRQLLIIMLLAGLAVTASAQFSVPFKWHHQVKDGILTIEVDIPEHHYIYEKSTVITAKNPADKLLPLATMPQAEEYNDPYSGKVNIYKSPKAVWTVKLSPQDYPVKLSIKSQGCRKAYGDKAAACFMPQNLSFTISGKPEEKILPEHSTQTVPASSTDSDFQKIAKQFTVTSTRVGVISPDKFVYFLKGISESDFFAKRSFAMIFLIIILGGLALNLTPCVLPMLPINLAIIGAGIKAESEWTGFIRGGIYGLGMALAYGILGVIVVRTGGQFGTLNSTAWFNFAIAVIFIILSLAMFDIFTIDLSKYGSKFGHGTMEKSKIISIFLLGAVMALLAGACVAPVVIAVILYASSLYNNGHFFAQFLPLLLGLGMALPWPIAGAGMSIMPKPGKWMLKVKYSFGFFIIFAALYYAYIGYTLLPLKSTSNNKNNITELVEGLKRAKASGKPVMIDFWATWCKNCLQMSSTTLKDPKVLEELKNYEFIKFQAENFDDPATAEVLKHFQVQGLPTFIIAKPQK